MKRQSSHEREAEELRAGIEKLIAVSDRVRDLCPFDADSEAVLVYDLQRLLDSVDARDSLAFLEKKSRRKKKGARK